MIRILSLRLRLTLIVLLPLLAVAAVAGAWQLGNARTTAADVFNRSLLSAALAVETDVAVSGGDALTPDTREILKDTSGGPVFYHVFGPDGVIVAGYATPPVGIPRAPSEVTGPTYFDAVYLGRDVSGVRVQSLTEIEGFSGIFTTTVWQETTVRNAFVRDLVSRSFITIAGLIASVALIVWFGIRLGLRPLLDLQNAIEARSADELTPIRRPVPEEVSGVVEKLNDLFTRVSRSMTAQSEFISNAAHQLRNPIAGVLSLAEAVKSAPSPEEAQSRASDLLVAAQETADLTNKLLAIERAKAISPSQFHEPVDLEAELRAWLPGFKTMVGQDVDLSLQIESLPAGMKCDPTMLREALANLIDNAAKHGGAHLRTVELRAKGHGTFVELTVADDGQGIPSDQIARASERFAQVSASSGSGLGLTIAEAVAAGHGGELEIVTLETGGLAVTLRMPLLS